MSETNTVSPLRQRMIEDMAARKLNPNTQRSHIYSCKRFAAWLGEFVGRLDGLGMAALCGAATGAAIGLRWLGQTATRFTLAGILLAAGIRLVVF
jgi:hypothetical protein